MSREGDIMDVLGYIKDLEFSELIRLCVNIDKNAKEYHNIDNLDDKEADKVDFILSQYEDSKLVFLKQYFPENSREDMKNIFSFCERENDEEFKEFVKENKDKKMNLIGMTLDSTVEDDFELARTIILKNKLSDPIPHQKSWQTIYAKTLKPLFGYKPKKQFSENQYFSRKQMLMYKVRGQKIFEMVKISELEEILKTRLPEEYKEYTNLFLYLLIDYCTANHKDINDYITFLSLAIRRLHLLRHEDDIMSPSNEQFIETIIKVLDDFLDNK
jgi:hypothetical protein